MIDARVEIAQKRSMRIEAEHSGDHVESSSMLEFRRRKMERMINVQIFLSIQKGRSEGKNILWSCSRKIVVSGVLKIFSKDLSRRILNGSLVQFVGIRNGSLLPK